MTISSTYEPLRAASSRSMAAPLVVAVDGSRASLEAVVWAAREAASLHRPLRLINVIDWPYDGGGGGVQDAATLSAEVLAESRARAVSVVRGLDVLSESVWGRVGPLLVETARDAHTVVLGHRAGGGFAEMVLGSHAVAVATHATVPVVVVPEPPQGSWRPPRPVVVLGVDAGGSSRDAAMYAFDHAARHGYQVEAVAADQGGQPSGGGSDLVHETASAFPSVEWREGHVAGTPAEALTAAANTEAALLVVGCRSRRDRSSPLLGSVSRGAIFLARCPVAVV